MRRLKNMGPPCTRPQGCPKGHIDDQKSLSARNRMAYDFYLQCKAVGEFPDDESVRQTAKVVYQMEQIEARKSSMYLEAFVMAQAKK